MGKRWDDLKDILKYVMRSGYRSGIKKRLKTTTYEGSKNGQCPEKQNILIIERLTETVGTFSDYLVFLRYIEQALENGWIPVIDRQTTKNIALPEQHVTANAWEIFFEQPANIGLDDIDNSKMNIYRCYTSDLCRVSLLHCRQKEIIAYWREIAAKYVRFNQETYDFINYHKDRLLNGKRVLGVSVREGYTRSIEAKSSICNGHALQASTEQLIEDVNRYLKEWDCKYIFVACQTVETMSRFTETYGDKVLFYDRKRVNYEELATNVDDEKNIQMKDSHRIQNERDYVTEIYLLSCCTSFLCSENSGTEAVFIMSSGFEHFYCYNLGIYI